VGTVVRTGEDEDPIGVMTVLNTHQHKQQPFMQQIRQYMVDKCSEAAAKDAIIKVPSAEQGRGPGAAQQQHQQQPCAASRARYFLMTMIRQ